MKKVIYYFVDQRGSFPIVRMYNIVGNNVTMFGEVEGFVGCNVVEVINQYLNDNGYGDEFIELVLVDIIDK